MNRLTLLSTALLSGVICFTATATADVLLTETFDNNSGFSQSVGFFSDGQHDYFGINGSAEDWGDGTTPSGQKGYTGFTDNFLTGEDLDGEGATLPITLNWTGIDVSNQSDLTFSGDFGASDTNLDRSDEWYFEVQFDGNGFTKVMEFVFDPNHPDSINAGFFYGSEALTSVAKNFSANINGTGSSMDLRMTIDFNSGSEDFAVDNLRVASFSAIPEPGSLAVLGLIGCVGLVRRRRR
ncbi:MAG: PEP-CTERM sorting domain-containing protein [Mariniblastus sp.]|nr:PEP-CTERM sorting domain-containing protein [Mariniblastus sp.]